MLGLQEGVPLNLGSTLMPLESHGISFIEFYTVYTRLDPFCFPSQRVSLLMSCLLVYGFVKNSSVNGYISIIGLHRKFTDGIADGVSKQ